MFNTKLCLQVSILKKSSCDNQVQEYDNLYSYLGMGRHSEVGYIEI